MEEKRGVRTRREKERLWVASLPLGCHPGMGLGTGPCISDQGVSSPRPMDWFKVARQGALALGRGRGDERKSGGWAADPRSHPEAALPVPLAGAGPPSQVSATSGRCAAE